MAMTARELETRQIAHDNIRAKAEVLGLWHHLRNIHAVEEDRLYATADVTLPLALARAPAMHSAIASRSHERLFRIFPHGTPETTPLSSYRENARPSLQVTFFVVMDRDEHGAELETGTVYADLDIDLGSPGRGLVGAFIHLVEVLVPGRTDPRRVRRLLEEDERVAARLEVIGKENEDRRSAP